MNGAGGSQWALDIIACVMSLNSEEGVLQTRIMVKESKGGTGKPDWIWMLCGASLLTYAAIKSGGLSRVQARPALEYMISLQGVEGWPYKVELRLGKFRGPGGEINKSTHIRVDFLLPFVGMIYGNNRLALISATASERYW